MNIFILVPKIFVWLQDLHCSLKIECCHVTILVAVDDCLETGSILLCGLSFEPATCITVQTRFSREIIEEIIEEIHLKIFHNFIPDIDECLLDGICSSRDHCLNLYGSFTCIARSEEARIPGE